MIDAPLAYAFGVGMVATFNPCGFAMLPAYLSYFLGLEGAASDERRGSVPRAIAIAAAMTAGFLVVFGVFGIVLNPVIGTIQQHLPWVTIVLGTGLVALGVWILTGHSFTVNIPRLTKGGDSRAIWSIFLFGVSYALVSLSCTMPLFISVVTTTFKDTNFVSGVGVLLAYGLGMGMVLMVLTVAVAVANKSLVSRMKNVMPLVDRISGVLLVIAGLYVTYYGWYEMHTQSGKTSGGGPANFVFNLNSRVSNWIQDTGPVRLGLAFALIISIAIFVGLLKRSVRNDAADQDSSQT